MTVQPPDAEPIGDPATHSPGEAARPYGLWTALLILLVLIFRVVMLPLSASGLHGDEAQYWAWAQDPAFGYYSKPPLIAWIIWTTTVLFGDAEWAVRLASPFLHAGVAAFTFLSARRLHGPEAGLFAAALYLLMPGVALSASIISTDAALLFCLSAFLYAWIRLRERPDGVAGWGWTLSLGIALGFGFLAKYAMMYVLPAFLLAVLLEPRTRAALLGMRGVVAGLVAGAILLPNLIWNARHDFATLVHTTDNANLGGGIALNPVEWLEFFGGQFGVFGPLTFALLMIALWQRRQGGGGLTLYLVLLVLTPLIAISVQALISRANANWAAAAYAAAPILLAGWAVERRWRCLWTKVGIGLNLFLGAVPALVLTSADLTDRLGFSNAVKRQRGWPETVEAIRARYDQGGFEMVAMDNRLMFYATTYYGMQDVAPLRMWRYEPRLNSHAELTSALPIGAEDVLIVSYYDSYADYFARDFETLSRLETVEIDLGGGQVRRLWLYGASGYKGPVPRD